MAKPDVVARPAVDAAARWITPGIFSRGRVRWIVLRWSLRLGLFVWFLFAAAVLTLRYWILPDADRYRPDLERIATQSLGLGVSIGSMTGGWDGLRPELTLADVRIANRQGHTVLAFGKVDAVLSWRSLAVFEPSLHRLEVEAPALHVQRDADGHLFVAGIAIDPTVDQDAGLADWVLRQKEIVVRDALLIWEDALRAAPPLFLERLNLRLENSGGQHRFGLNGRPSGNLAAGVEVRGDLSGEAVADFADWGGTLFAEVEAVDLAGWRSWFDYPIELPQGRGGLRLWLGVEHGQPVSVTADVALQDVRMRLAANLPELDLVDLQGRVRARQKGFGARRAFVVSGRQVAVVTRDGIRIEPTDFEAEWAPQDGDASPGRFTADRIDVGVLAQLAAALPLAAKTRQLLADYAPRGRLADVKLNWLGNAEAAREYGLKARFEGLGARAQGIVPGFSGLTGSVELDQHAGHVELRSAPVALELPAVFAEPVIAFDKLDASVRWQIKDGELKAQVEQARFAGSDAVGSAQGSYQRKLVDGGAGSIDLKARLEQADGRAVWRYIPKLVSAEARSWLKTSILGGTASDVQLQLTGDLDRFPFRQKGEGRFLITAKVRDAIVDYADGWPRIEKIAGEMRFEGAAMFIDARQGSILGTRLAATSANILDLDAKEPRLDVKGSVDGPTSEFLKYIEASPVGASIDHFTRDIQAVGSGRLDLALSIPLTRVEQTRIKGEFQLINNQVTVDAALPPVMQTNGRLSFTADEVNARELTGMAFGAPVKVSVRTQGDRVAVNVLGSASVAALRQQWESPVFDHLSGSAPWRAEILARGRQASVVVESPLQGISSSLPEPFNKTAGDAMPLRIERTMLAADAVRRLPAVPRDQWKLSLGRVASGQLQRRLDGPEPITETGALAIGEPLRLPEHGIAVHGSVARLDFDAWRSVVQAAAETGSAAADVAPRPLPQVALKATVLSMLGRDWHDVSLSTVATVGGLQGRIDSRELSGDWSWELAGKGRLRARLKKLAVPAANNGGPRNTVAEALDSLPGLDLVIDEFALGAKKLGRLEMEATNEERLWRINRLVLVVPEAQLSGTGRWRFAGGDRTRLDFKLDVRDVGKLLERFGYADAVRRGTATLEGRIGWFGVPTAIDYPTLGGEVRLAVAKGQFAQLEPGLGKLLSLLSLQMLPRRITLDFRDVFSEGFAFDSIAGRFLVNNGQMRTDDLKVEGPSAKVLMRGDIDLQQETQNLKVTIQPEVGGTVALGAAVVNPIAGAVALLAQKMLSDPLNKAFAFEYAITGPWADPKVEKLGRREPPAADAPRSEAARESANDSASQ